MTVPLECPYCQSPNIEPAGGGDYECVDCHAVFDEDGDILMEGDT